MFEIDELKIEGVREGCITDSDVPSLAFSLKSDLPQTCLANAKICVGDREIITDCQTGVPLDGIKLAPFSKYTVAVTAFDNHGNSARKCISFKTGRKSLPWTAKWITDKLYTFAKRTSPLPFTFRKKFSVKKPIKRAIITSTALGVYELELNGKKVGNEYFAPGFTSYKNIIQYNLYDVTGLLGEHNEIVAVVGGGWAVGRFTYSSKSAITCRYT